eukprot:365020-Chlamydomonas_euryale.AAC.6
MSFVWSGVMCNVCWRCARECVWHVTKVLASQWPCCRCCPVAGVKLEHLQKCGLRRRGRSAPADVDDGHCCGRFPATTTPHCVAVPTAPTDRTALRTRRRHAARHRRRPGSAAARQVRVG